MNQLAGSFEDLAIAALSVVNRLVMFATSMVLGFGQGLLKPQGPQIKESSGLVERYLALGIPTIHLLNIKQLCAESGVPFDPVEVAPDGTSSVYDSRNYSKAAIAATAARFCGGLGWMKVGEKRKKP